MQALLLPIAAERDHLAAQSWVAANATAYRGSIDSLSELGAPDAAHYICNPGGGLDRRVVRSGGCVGHEMGVPASIRSLVALERRDGPGIEWTDESDEVAERAPCAARAAVDPV